MSNAKLRGRKLNMRPESDAKVEKSFAEVMAEMGPDKPSPLLKDEKFLKGNLEYVRKVKEYFEKAVFANIDQINVLTTLNKMYERDIAVIDQRIAEFTAEPKVESSNEEKEGTNLEQKQASESQPEAGQENNKQVLQDTKEVGNK